MDKLPNELHLEIIKYLPLNDLKNLKQINSLFYYGYKNQYKQSVEIEIKKMIKKSRLKELKWDGFRANEIKYLIEQIFQFYHNFPFPWIFLEKYETNIRNVILREDVKSIMNDFKVGIENNRSGEKFGYNGEHKVVYVLVF